MLENVAWKVDGPQRVQLRARSWQRAGTEGASGPSILIDVELEPGSRKMEISVNPDTQNSKTRWEPNVGKCGLEGGRDKPSTTEGSIVAAGRNGRGQWAQYINRCGAGAWEPQGGNISES